MVLPLSGLITAMQMVLDLVCSGREAKKRTQPLMTGAESLDDLQHCDPGGTRTLNLSEKT